MGRLGFPSSHRSYKYISIKSKPHLAVELFCDDLILEVRLGGHWARMAVSPVLSKHGVAHRTPQRHWIHKVCAMISLVRQSITERPESTRVVAPSARAPARENPG